MWLAANTEAFRTTGINRLLILVSLYIVAMDNDRLWFGVWAMLGQHLAGHLVFILSFGLLLLVLTLLLLSLFSFVPIIKPALIIVLLQSSISAYYMDDLPVVVGNSMKIGPLPASLSGVDALRDTGLLWHVMLFGLLPSVLVYLARIESGSLAVESLSRIRLLSVLSLVLTLSIFWAYRDYSLLARQSSSLRYLVNPVYSLVSLYGYVKSEPGQGTDSCGSQAASPERAFAGHCSDDFNARDTGVSLQQQQASQQRRLSE